MHFRLATNDLVLLGANPLENIQNTREIGVVMVRGRWLPEAELQAMLDKIATSYEAKGVINLVPYANEAISGVVPDAWGELAPGVQIRSDPSSDPTILVQRAAPNGLAEELVSSTLGEFGVDRLSSEPMDTFQSENHSWTIYMVKGQSILGIAIAKRDMMTYLALLSTAPAEANALVKAILFPVLASLAPAG